MHSKGRLDTRGYLGEENGEISRMQNLVCQAKTMNVMYAITSNLLDDQAINALVVIYFDNEWTTILKIRSVVNVRPPATAAHVRVCVCVCVCARNAVVTHIVNLCFSYMPVAFRGTRAMSPLSLSLSKQTPMTPTMSQPHPTSYPGLLLPSRCRYQRRHCGRQKPLPRYHRVGVVQAVSNQAEQHEIKPNRRRAPRQHQRRICRPDLHGFGRVGGVSSLRSSFCWTFAVLVNVVLAWICTRASQQRPFCEGWDALFNADGRSMLMTSLRA